MSSPEFYPHPVTHIEQRETHISKIFLTGPYVYKIKKPVDLEFLDFTTLEMRQHFCHREVILNRRLTTDIYLDVVAITFNKGQYDLSGPEDKIRDCHGDLRTGHIYFKGGIKILDCIEFNDRLRYADITADLGFLTMDLDFQRCPNMGHELIDAYVQFAKDQDVLVLLDF